MFADDEEPIPDEPVVKMEEVETKAEKEPEAKRPTGKKRAAPEESKKETAKDEEEADKPAEKKVKTEAAPAGKKVKKATEEADKPTEQKIKIETSPAGKQAKKEATRNAKPKLSQRFATASKSIKQFCGGVFSKVCQKLLGKKSKKKPEQKDKYGLDRLDVFIDNFLNTWGAVTNYSSCRQAMEKQWLDIFVQSNIFADSQKKQLEEAAKLTGEAFTHQMTMFYALLTVDGCEQTIKMLQHMEEIPDE